jgi:amino acid transporter
MEVLDGSTSEQKPRAHGLGQLASTAICGNDITSSTLYVSALAIIYAGKWAPVSLLMVVGVLYLFRSVYAEVVGALPLNGGAYNALLNTTSKFRASIAASLTILSYMATAVISANEAMHYAHGLWSGLPIIGATVVLLALFMILTISGITESAGVAIVIFILHLTTLVILLLAGGWYVATHGLGTLTLNLETPSQGGLMTALFFGFAASMLGISGFESSANFVEEQKPGVFPKTLRNMWIAVTVFNPGIALLALALIPISEVGAHQQALLSFLGEKSGGAWLGTLVSVDASLVLSGAVLTSFVGVNGLMHRMTLDRCLPQFLLKKNSRGTTYRIMILFFLLTVSVLLITEGDLKALAGVYTLSFLAVMALFGIGNVLLKVRRARLPRPTHAPWIGVIIAILAVTAALVGNAVMNPAYLRVFLTYFIPTMLVIGVMLGRIRLLKAGLFVVGAIGDFVLEKTSRLTQFIGNWIASINAQQFVFFSHFDDPATLNKVLLYIRENEHTSRLKVVTVIGSGEKLPPTFESDLHFLDEVYPDVEIEFVRLEGDFGPKLIKELSEKWQIPSNLMFIGSPGDHFPYGLADLGGVRLII